MTDKVKNCKNGITFESIALRWDRWAPFIGWSSSQSSDDPLWRHNYYFSQISQQQCRIESH